MKDPNAAMGRATLPGIALVATGLIGFLDTPLVGGSPNALVATDNVQDVVHLVTGLVALYVAFGLKGEQRANAILGFGILYVIILVAVLVSPTLLGIFSVAANGPIHVIHAAVAVVSLAIGYTARGRTSAMAR